MLSHQYHSTSSMHGYLCSRLDKCSHTFVQLHFLHFLLFGMELNHFPTAQISGNLYPPPSFCLSFYLVFLFKFNLFWFVFCNSHVFNCSPHLLLLVSLVFFFLLLSPRCIYLILIQWIQRNIGQIYCSFTGRNRYSLHCGAVCCWMLGDLPP